MFIRWMFFFFFWAENSGCLVIRGKAGSLLFGIGKGGP